MSERLAELISAAMVECEKEMNGSMEGREPTDIPREWFSYHSMQRRLTPLMHQAEQMARIGH